MSDLLVDASVAIKWLFREDLSERAEALLRGALVQQRHFACPPHFTSEVITSFTSGRGAETRLCA